jgi:hypothetical protein
MLVYPKLEENYISGEIMKEYINELILVNNGK